MAVNIIEGGSATIKTPQQRSDKSAQINVFSEEGELGIIIPRFIYSKLGNHTANKTVTLENLEDESNEYELFMMDMERYSQTGEDLDNISALDNYLGSLGDGATYPFDDDTYDTTIWNIEEQLPYRNVAIDEETNVIIELSGIDYNVIHSTQN